MKKYFINEEKTFALNDDLEARVERLEKGKSSKPKKKRKPSAYNNFFKTEMPKVKKEFPDMEHSKAFKEVT